MKVLGLDLDNSPYIAQDKSLRYAKNITIDNKGCLLYTSDAADE
mgnify:CR=1 FL=1